MLEIRSNFRFYIDLEREEWETAGRVLTSSRPIVQDRRASGKRASESNKRSISSATVRPEYRRNY